MPVTDHHAIDGNMGQKSIQSICKVLLIFYLISGELFKMLIFQGSKSLREHDFY
jgi:hypothetical protein